MLELELEIARTLGASSFLIYQFIKHNPGSRVIDIQTETGLSEYCVWQNLTKLKDCNIVHYKEVKVVKRQTTRAKEFRENEERETWKFH